MAWGMHRCYLIVCMCVQHKREVNELKAVQRQLQDNISQLELELTKKEGK